jgi:hypothetical protein
MEHEHIIASGVYYVVASDNIASNHLEFRTMLDESSFYDEHGREGETVSLIDDLGSEPTPAGKGLVWHNSLQHKVGELTVPADSQSAGIRKILCFFLVDPKRRIVSTAIVPKQQGVLSLEEAMRHRQELMNERKYEANAVTQEWEERIYSFCEH